MGGGKVADLKQRDCCVVMEVLLARSERADTAKSLDRPSEVRGLIEPTSDFHHGSPRRSTGVEQANIDIAGLLEVPLLQGAISGIELAADVGRETGPLRRGTHLHANW